MSLKQTGLPSVRVSVDSYALQKTSSEFNKVIYNLFKFPGVRVKIHALSRQTTALVTPAVTPTSTLRYITSACKLIAKKISWTIIDNQ